METETTGQRLLYAIKNSDMTQRKFAELIGMSPNGLNMIVRGRNRLNRRLALATEAITGINHKWIMLTDDNPYNGKMTNYNFDRRSVNDQENIKRIQDDHIFKPDHYNKSEIEPLDYILANKLDFVEGNIIKYITRYKHKDGIKDLIKAQDYLTKLIEREGENEGYKPH